MRNEALDHDMESNSYKFIINLVLMKLSQKLKLYLTRSDRKKRRGWAQIVVNWGWSYYQKLFNLMKTNLLFLLF